MLQEERYTPPYQFAFKHGDRYADTLMVVANALFNAFFTGRSLALACHDVRLTFNSLIHILMFLRASIRGLNPTFIRSKSEMHAMQRVRLKIPLRKDKWQCHWIELYQLRKEPRKVLLPHLINSIIMASELKTSVSCLAFFLTSIPPYSHMPMTFFTPVELWTKENFWKFLKFKNRILKKRF